MESYIKPEVDLVGPWEPHHLAVVDGWEVPHLIVYVTDGPSGQTVYRLSIGLSNYEVDRSELDHAIDMIAAGVAAGMGLVSFPSKEQAAAVPVPPIRRLTGLTFGTGEVETDG